jgi:nitrate/nitrite transporter NarK
MQQRPFYGWWITALAFLTFGLAVGIPYYGGPFFYDYYEKSFGWSRPDITFGFPLAATLTLWVGPLVVPKFSPRWLIVAGTGLTALAFLGFSQMQGSLTTYYGLWHLYIVGYIFSGPIAHQVIVSQWFKRQRGFAMAIVYLGVGVFGGISAKFIAKPLTEAFGDFRMALMGFAACVLLAWPIAIFFLKDRPAELGQNPDGDAVPPAETKAEPKSFGYLLRQPAFWLLLVGSVCSIGSIGSINQHMKFVFKEQGYADQKVLDAMFADATLYILFASIGGRLFMGWLADRYNKKLVMLATYGLVAGTIPLLLLVNPSNESMVYVFSILFGFGMGADYMLIPLMAAETFGVNSLARAMSIILPADTLGQTWFPFIIAKLRVMFGSYTPALNVVFAIAAVGAFAILLLPRSKPAPNETLHVQDPERAAARG